MRASTRARSARVRSALATVLLAEVAVGCAHTEQRGAEPGASAQQADRPQCPSHELEQRLTAQSQAPVIVLLQPSGEDAETQIGRVLAPLAQDFQLERRYASLPGFAGVVTSNGLEQLRAQPDVRCVQLDRPGSGGGPAAR